MPYFYFHLATPTKRYPDEIGLSCESADHAMLEAWQAIAEMTGELLAEGTSPLGYRFEVDDAHGAPVFNLPFYDLFARPRGYRLADQDVIRTQISETLERSRSLQREVGVAVAELRTTLSRTRELLANSRPPDPK